MAPILLTSFTATADATRPLRKLRTLAPLVALAVTVVATVATVTVLVLDGRLASAWSQVGRLPGWSVGAGLVILLVAAIGFAGRWSNEDAEKPLHDVR